MNQIMLSQQRVILYRTVYSSVTIFQKLHSSLKIFHGLTSSSFSASKKKSSFAEVDLEDGAEWEYPLKYMTY